MGIVTRRIATLVVTAAVSIGAIAPTASAVDLAADPNPMCVGLNEFVVCIW